MDRPKPEAQVPAVPDVAAQRIQAHRMDTLGELASGLAHELGNSLAAITAFSQLVRLDPRLPADLRHDAELLVEEAERTRHLVQGLLDFARNRPAERHPTSLRVLVESVIGLLAYRIAEESIELQIDIERDLPPVALDRQAMQLVLLDLTIRARERLSIQAAAHESLIRLSVSHAGPSAPDLAVARSIVAAHGGRLRHDSEFPRAQAAYVVELPLPTPARAVKTEATEAGRPSADQTRPAHPIRVLVLDDELPIRRFLGKALEVAGYEPVLATRGDEAVELASSGEFGAILCDYRMARMTGMEVYEAIVARRPEMGPRFVFMSGDVLNPALVDFAAAHGVRLLAKPFDIASVGRIVEEVLAAPQPRG